MKLLVILSAFFAVACAVNPAALYRSRCSEGASYWCENASQAGECGAVEYCIQNFWRGISVQESASCMDCEAFINAIDNVLAQTSVQEEIVDGAKQACVVMGSLMDLCQTLVETLGAEALQELVKELSADEACTVLGFCTKSVAVAQKTNEGSPEVCDLCKDALQEVSTLLSDTAIQQNIENTILALCPLLKDVLPNCAQMVQDDFPEVIQLLLAYLNPESCTLIGLCPGTEKMQELFTRVMNLRNRVGDQLCDDCKSTLGEIDAVLSNAAFQKTVQLELDQICYTFGPAAPICLLLVNTYTSQIITTLATYLQPDSFCAEFGFCPSDLPVSQIKDISVGADMCTDCKTFVGDFDSLLLNVSYQKLITDEMDQLCDQLGAFSAQCKSYVDMYASLVFTFLASEIDPQQVCQTVGFCSTKRCSLKDIKVGADECTDCKAFFTDIDGLLKNATVQNMIINEIDQLCDQLGAFSAQCKSYVDMYASLVFNFVASELDPDQVCETIGFCPAHLLRLLKKLNGPSKVCTDCEQFFSDVVTALQDPTVEGDILNAVEQVCSLFGSSAGMCQDYVSQYGMVVIQFIVESIDPDTVCNDLGFCMSSVSHLVKKVKIGGPSKICTDCEVFFQDVDTKLQDPNVQSAILNALEQVCSVFGSSASMCQDYLDQYGGVVIQFIVESIDADTVCNDLGMCMSSVPKKLKEKKFKKQKVGGPSKVCTDCEVFFQDVATKLQDPNVQNTILNALEQVCSLFGSSASMCQDYLSQYGGVVIQFIFESIDADTVCNDLGMCMSAARPVSNDPSLGGPSKVCTDCGNFMADVQTALSDPNVQNTIVTVIESVCSLFGSSADMCRNYVDQYGGLVIQFIVSSVDPGTVCNDIGFCMSVFAREQRIGLKVDECTDCKAFFGDVQGLLNNVTVENMITQDLEALCAQLGSFADQCKSYVDQYAFFVYSFLASEINPDQICSLVQFCPSEVQNSAATCAMCESLVTAAETYISSEKSQEEIEMELEALCAKLGPFAAQCNSLVQTYTSTIINMVLSYMDPKTVCTEIKMCPGTSRISKVRADPTVCTDCKTFMADIVTMLNSTEFQKEIIAEVESLCSMAGSLEAECKLLVETYLPPAFSYLIAALDPDTVCVDLGFCTSKKLTTIPLQSQSALPQIQPMESLTAARPLPHASGVTATSTGCEFCKTIVGIFSNMLMENKTEEEILDAVSELCDVLPTAEKLTCIRYVKDYGYLILEMLKNSLDPESVCKEIGECTSATKITSFKSWKGLKKLLAAKLPTDDKPFCSLCQLAVQELDTILSSNKSKEEIKQDVEKYICGNLPSPLNGQCVSFMMIYGDVLVQLLIEQFDPTTFCAEVGLCDSTTKLPKPVPQVEASTECVVCEFMVKELEKLITENSTEVEIRQALDKVCQQLPGTITSECESLVNTYTEEIVDYLVRTYNPKALCLALRICEPGEKAIQAKANPPECALCELIVAKLEKDIPEDATEAEIRELLDDVCDELPATIRTECDAFVKTFEKEMIEYLVHHYGPKGLCVAINICSPGIALQAKTEPKMSPDCILCEYVLSEVDSLLGENATEAEIEAALDKVCDVLPATLTTECEDFVDQYGPFLISYLVQELDPTKFCTEIGLCGSEKVVIEEPTASEECVICEFVLQELDTVLEKNSTEAEIKKALDEVCDALPATVRSECENFVTTYEPLLIKYLVDESPDQICTLFKLCTAKLIVIKEPTASEECVICEFVLQELDTMLEKNSTEAEIKKALDEVCDALPATVRSECENFVATYEPLLIKYLVDESPDQICTLFKLCTGKLTDSIECDLCQTAVREFMDTIQEPSVSKEIVAVINDTCAILPEDIKTTCYTYVDQYGDLVTQFIAQFFDPITTCTLLDACPYPDNSPIPTGKAPRKRLIGQHECTQGPAYWCSSMETATSCGMVEHCQRHVWN